MKYIISVLLGAILICSVVYSQTPKFSSITISGVAKEPYDKVSLFADGHAVKPLRTSIIDSKSRRYSITINAKKDMATYDSGDIGVDMRFWKDTNNNEEFDKDEKRSQCHFMLWDPKTKQMILQVYGGPTYKIDSSTFTYDYGRILTEEVIQVQGLDLYKNSSKTPLSIRDYPEATALELAKIEPNYTITLRGILHSGWVVTNPEGYVYDPKFVKFSLMDFEVESDSGEFKAVQKDISVYTHPSTEADTLFTLKKGYILPITGQVKGQPWYQLEVFTDGTKGYALKE